MARPEGIPLSGAGSILGKGGLPLGGSRFCHPIGPLYSCDVQIMGGRFDRKSVLHDRCCQEYPPCGLKQRIPTYLCQAPWDRPCSVFSCRLKPYGGPSLGMWDKGVLYSPSICSVDAPCGSSSVQSCNAVPSLANEKALPVQGGWCWTRCTVVIIMCSGVIPTRLMVRHGPGLNLPV